MAATRFQPQSQHLNDRAEAEPNLCQARGLAAWLINGLTGAFFASLERCSCIQISTHEDDFGSDEATDIPLIFHDANLRGDNHVRRRRIGKGKKSRLLF
ncbi:hypothetical protein F511_01322 [Dorcoceras hygrometricum]|uniref:Uncharacterized protein n=1 Tax=Dorcoceras hygrometricum TaxID=472368 RepID=A0A2Z7D4F1_9LAMI|nr:hypothetical protein F511_01322 [Dorcoceras hygrometricum]